MPGGPTTRPAPAPNAVTMSDTDGSNPIDASCKMRIPWSTRARASLDRHATYIVAAYIAGAAR
jgi:hypothetical protein